MPTIGFEPKVERASLAYLPFCQGNWNSERHWRSAKRIGTDTPSRIWSNPLGKYTALGLRFLISPSQSEYNSKRRFLCHAANWLRASPAAPAVARAPPAPGGAFGRETPNPLIFLNFRWQGCQ